MKKIYLVIIGLALLIMSGCTQYNGYIGPIFGSWALVEMTENGEPMQIEYETIFSFQNEVVQVLKLIDPPYTVMPRYGNFSISEDVLTLKFQDKPTPDDSYKYMTPEWLHFPEDGLPIHFDVKKLNGSEMILSLDNEGKVYGYSFKKTW